MAESRHISERYTKLGQELIDEEDEFCEIGFSEATIVFLASDKRKKSHGRYVFGECEKVADKNKWAIPADFTVTIFEPNCLGMDDELIKRVLFHELLHVGVEYDKDGDPVFSVRPHDMEDFRACVERWGVDWYVKADDEETGD